MKHQLSKADIQRLLKIYSRFIIDASVMCSVMKADISLQPTIVAVIIQAKQLVLIAKDMGMGIEKYTYILKFDITSPLSVKPNKEENGK